MDREMLWFITLKNNFCKVFIHTEGQWIIEFCCSQDDLFPFFLQPVSLFHFCTTEIASIAPCSFFFVNATFKAETGFSETKIQQFGSR